MAKLVKAKCDSKGRLYLRDYLRGRYGDSFIIVDLIESMVLIPLRKNPEKDLDELGKALKGASLEEIKQRIRRTTKPRVGS